MGWKSHPLAQEVNQDLNNVVNFVTSIPDMSKEELGSASAKLTSSAMSAAATWAFFKSFRAPASGRNNLVTSQKTAQSPVVQSVDDVVSSANSAGKKRRDIVGTDYDKVLPTQDWINPLKVEEYKSLLQSGQKLPTIDAYRQGGRIFIEDGHHRFAAYMELGMEPNMIIRNTGGPVGFPNWLSTSFQTP